MHRRKQKNKIFPHNRNRTDKQARKPNDFCYSWSQRPNLTLLGKESFLCEKTGGDGGLGADMMSCKGTRLMSKIGPRESSPHSTEAPWGSDDGTKREDCPEVRCTTTWMLSWHQTLYSTALGELCRWANGKGGYHFCYLLLLSFSFILCIVFYVFSTLRFHFSMAWKRDMHRPWVQIHPKFTPVEPLC